VGVTLDYYTIHPVNAQQLQQIRALVPEANQARSWWCESIWVSETPDDGGYCFGCNKLFCLIDDVATDTYMAYLDAWAVMAFLADIGKRLRIDWRIQIAGSPLGKILNGVPDEALNANLDGFLDPPEDFVELKARAREQILAQWSGR
jgi:hypothetical protein